MSGIDSAIKAISNYKENDKNYKSNKREIINKLNIDNVNKKPNHDVISFFKCLNSFLCKMIRNRSKFEPASKFYKNANSKIITDDKMSLFLLKNLKVEGYNSN